MNVSVSNSAGSATFRGTVAGNLRVVFRLTRLVTHLIKGVVYAKFLLGGVEQGDPSPRQLRIIQRWLTQLANVIGFDVKVSGSGTHSPGSALVVANHMAWTDILVIATALPVCFLSNASVRTWPVAGFLARRSGTLFIERGASTGVRQTVCRHLQRGRTVAVFPEGRTYRDGTVGKFHARLFGSAIEAGVSVIPVAIRYLDESGSYNVDAAFVRGEGMLSHTLRQMRATRNHVEVVVCSPIDTRGSDRETVARLAQEKIRRQLEFNTSRDAA